MHSGSQTIAVIERSTVELPGAVRRAARPGLLVGLLLLATALPALAQNTGTVTGRIVAAETQQPLAQVQVFLRGTSLGSLSTAQGRFMILAVPPGTYTLRVERIGYKAMEQQVTVQAGQSAQANFELAEEVLGLDEIVVTGTAGQARRREVGNAITQLNADQLLEPVESVEQMLKARVPAMSVLTTSGTIASGARIRLRGNVSISMSNQPLIYVDGVRIRSDGYPDSWMPTENTSRGPNSSSTPLNDINPSDIERIEIVKGPAATTLYGTEAAAGVIQIFTKRGRPGRSVWTFETAQGVDYLWKYGPPQAPYWNLDKDPRFKQNGWKQRYDMSVSGGTERFGYFASGGYQNNEGVLPNDWQEVVSLRTNLAFEPISNLSFRLNNMYTRQDVQETTQGNNPNSFLLNIMHTRAPFCDCDPDNPDDFVRLLDYSVHRPIDHFITGFTASYAPTSKISSKLTVGYDWVQREVRQVMPFGFITKPEGTVHTERWQGETLTLDFVNSYSFGIAAELGSTFSAGGQFIQASQSTVGGQSIGLPGPTEPTLSTGAELITYESIQRVVTGGYFAQEQLSYKDRYFFTAGVRVDGNSAFGEDFGFEVYPKLSFSHVLSDQPWWNDAWGEAKLRAAWGFAGRAPGAFDAVRTWQSEPWQGKPAFRPLNLGNAALAPERTREVEAGFDGVFFNNRLNATFTWYDRVTDDALMPVSQPASAGFTSSQLTNVGKIQTKGIEVSTDLTVFERERFGWSIGGTLATVKSAVLDLGGAPEFSPGRGRVWVKVGYPAPVVQGARILNPNEIANPVYEGRDGQPSSSIADVFLGPNEPDFMWSAFTTLTLPGRIEVSARGEYMGGHYVLDYGSWRTNVDRANPRCFDVYPLIQQNKLETVTAYWRAYCNSRIPQQFYVQPADFFKFREVSLRVPVSALLPGASNASLTVSGRNLWVWTKDEFTAGDPEMCCFKGVNDQTRSIYETIPAPISWTAALRVVF